MTVLGVVLRLISGLYAMDYGGVYVLNLLGYDVPFAMRAPWRAFSVREFWGKRWNQFVAHSTKEMVFRPILSATQSRRMAAVAGLVVLAAVHAYPIMMDGRHSSVVATVFGFFILQPMCMAVEERVILHRVCGSERVNAVVHTLLTAVLLGATFALSLFATCSAMQ